MKTTDILNIAGVAYKLYPHEETFDAQHLAAALRVPGHNVGKTVLLRADSSFAHIVAVLPATRTLDLRRVSDALGGADVQLATEVEIAEHCPDFEFGLLPPFGGKFGMKTIVGEPLIYLRDLRVEVEAAPDGRTARVTVLDNDADQSGEQPPVGGAEVVVHTHADNVLARLRTTAAGIAGFATPPDVPPSAIALSVRHPDFNPRHLRLDGSSIVIDLRAQLYGDKR